MGNVLLYTLLMAGITFAIGFFVAFIIKLVFNTIQRMMLVQTVEYKTGILRVRQINIIRKQNNLSSMKSVRDNEYQQKGNRFATKEATKMDTNEIVEYYYGKH